MSDSKSGSKNDLNESNMPLLDEVSSSETLTFNILRNIFFIWIQKYVKRLWLRCLFPGCSNPLWLSVSFIKGPSDGEDDEGGDPSVEEVDVATGNRQAQHSRLLKFVTAGSAAAKSTVSERPQHSEDKSDL